MDKIILIDGNSLMFRSYYATAYSNKMMQNKKGLYTNAIFGFCNMFSKILSDDAEYIFVAFDKGKQTFRHQEYSDYKGTRKSLPDELRVQIPYIKEYIDSLNIKRAEMDNYEADDLIASVARMASEANFQVKVISGDRDLLQLVDENINVYLTKKGVGELEEYNINNFLERTGIYPKQVPDYKGLVGDSSDNLPGIKGIGEVTAVTLLNKYQTLDNIYNNIEELKSKQKELFIDSKDIAYKCKHLATLEKNIPLDFNIDDLKIKEFDEIRLTNLFKELEFESLLKKIGRKKVSIDTNIDGVTVINDVNYDFKNSLEENSFINVEVFKSNYYNGEFLGLAVINSQVNIFITKEVVLNNIAVKQFLEGDYFKYTFDYKKMYVVLKRHNLILKNVNFDLLLASYIINPSYASDDIKNVTNKFCENTLPYIEDIYKSATKMAIPEISVYAKYAIDKCSIIKLLKDDILATLKEQSLENLFTLEINLSKVLGDIELTGLLIDVDRLNEIGNTLVKKSKEISEEIYFIAGEEFNINSPKQLGDILFEKLRLPHGKKNKTGYSTSSDVLDHLAEKYIIARMVLEYRACTKLISTYVNGLMEVKDSNNYIHPLYKQALTVTGRLSSIEPNIQNMPIRTEEGQVIREIFTSRFKEGKIIAADYSQIELRILAHLSSDMNMIGYFNSGVDFHTKTASEIYEIPLEGVTKEMRRTAKAINFGIIYGISAWGLSENINISPLQANIFINKYFYTFSKAKEYLDNIITSCKENGYTETILKRRRYIEEIYSDNNNLRSFGERTAMNAPIQGSAADIIKMAMVAVYDEMKRMNLNSLIIAQVHDELVFDCPATEIKIMCELIKEKMESVIKMQVPLIASVDVGDNWLNAK